MAKSSVAKKRKWREEYTHFGFTMTKSNDGDERPQCILCNVLFCNANMKPSRLKEHFNNKHGGVKPGQDSESLKIKRVRFDSSGTFPKMGFVPADKPLLLASYKVAYEIAKNKKPHTIAENLIKPCALEMAGIVLGKEAKQKLQQVPLSDNVISSRISDMSDDILKQVITDIKSSPTKISMQLDESTDVAKCCQLLAIVRYAKGETVCENFLFCKPLQKTTTALDIFNMVKEFFFKHELDMSLIGSICTDGAPAMLGNRSGFAALLKQKLPTLKVTHCMIHRQALTSKRMPKSLKDVFDTCVWIVNNIRKNETSHRIFQSFCAQMGNQHDILLYHTEVRWLSRGRVMSRFFQLRETIKLYLQHRNSNLAASFESDEFVQSVAYIADVMHHLNELNLSRQGQQINVVTACEKVKAFKLKLSLWSRRIENGNLANFPSLDEIANNSLLQNVKNEIISHLRMLVDSFDGYFSAGELNYYQHWIINPFLFDLTKMSDDDNLKENLIEMKSCQELKLLFDKSKLEDFWCAAMKAFPSLAMEAMTVLIPFSTTYNCESSFSTMMYMKNKYRNRLQLEDDLRVATSKIEPSFERILSMKQQQISR